MTDAERKALAVRIYHFAHIAEFQSIAPDLLKVAVALSEPPIRGIDAASLREEARRAVCGTLAANGGPHPWFCDSPCALCLEAADAFLALLQPAAECKHGESVPHEWMENAWDGPHHMTCEGPQR